MDVSHTIHTILSIWNLTYRTCIYDEFTIWGTISSLHLWNMAFANLANFCKIFVVIRANDEGVPISFPSGSDGLAVVSTICLGLRFQLNIAFFHIDKEVYNLESWILSHIIGQIPMCYIDGKL